MPVDTSIRVPGSGTSPGGGELQPPLLPFLVEAWAVGLLPFLPGLHTGSGGGYKDSNPPLLAIHPYPGTAGPNDCRLGGVSAESKFTGNGIAVALPPSPTGSSMRAMDGSFGETS